MIDIDNLFSYHSPCPYEISQMKLIRDAAKNLATVIINNTPASADQTAAIRKVREAVMTANAAIVMNRKC